MGCSKVPKTLRKNPAQIEWFSLALNQFIAQIFPFFSNEHDHEMFELCTVMEVNQGQLLISRSYLIIFNLTLKPVITLSDLDYFTPAKYVHHFPKKSFSLLITNFWSKIRYQQKFVRYPRFSCELGVFCGFIKIK